MTQKKRHLVYEGIAAAVVAFFVGFAVPQMVSARDTMAVFAGIVLIVAIISWTVSLVVRVLKGF